MKNVLISGASIGGPALAFWLRRYGFNVTVVERFRGLRPGGQAVDVRGPALDVDGADGPRRPAAGVRTPACAA